MRLGMVQREGSGKRCDLQWAQKQGEVSFLRKKEGRKEGERECTPAPVEVYENASGGGLEEELAWSYGQSALRGISS